MFFFYCRSVPTESILFELNRDFPNFVALNEDMTPRHPFSRVTPWIRDAYCVTDAMKCSVLCHRTVMRFHFISFSRRPASAAQQQSCSRADGSLIHHAPEAVGGTSILEGGYHHHLTERISLHFHGSSTQDYGQHTSSGCRSRRGQPIVVQCDYQFDWSSDNCVSVFIGLPHSLKELRDQSLCSEISIPQSFVLFRNKPPIVHEVATQK